MLREFFNAILDAPAETWLMWAAIAVAVIVGFALIIGAANLFERIITWRLWRVPFIAGYFFAFFLFVAIITGIALFYVPENSWLMVVIGSVFAATSIAAAAIGFFAPFFWLTSRIENFAERRGYSEYFTFLILMGPASLAYLFAFFGIIFLIVGIMP